LYAGILLGLYVANSVPSEEEEMRELLGRRGVESRWAVIPLVNESGLDGFSAQFQVFRF